MTAIHCDIFWGRGIQPLLYHLHLQDFLCIIQFAIVRWECVWDSVRSDAFLNILPEAVYSKTGSQVMLFFDEGDSVLLYTRATSVLLIHS